MRHEADCSRRHCKDEYSRKRVTTVRGCAPFERGVELRGVLSTTLLAWRRPRARTRSSSVPSGTNSMLMTGVPSISSVP